MKVATGAPDATELVTRNDAPRSLDLAREADLPGAADMAGATDGAVAADLASAAVVPNEAVAADEAANHAPLGSATRRLLEGPVLPALVRLALPNMLVVVVQATMAFWTVETLEIMNSFTYGGEYAAEYPLSIYRPWFRRFFTFIIPLACANYFPALAILGKSDPMRAPIALQWLAPLAGPAFLIFALQLWKIGVRHYRSTGS